MKVSIIGSGFVGSTAAYRLLEKKIVNNVVLLDVNVGSAKGKALDLMQCAPFLYSDVKVKGTDNYEDISGSNIVVITAGFPRIPGMNRDDLQNKNADIIRQVVPNVAKYAPNSIIICVTNPLDVMTYLAYKLSGFHKSKVIGMAGMLDTVRFRAFISEKLKVSTLQVQSMVLGTHGDTMVPLVDHTYVAGISLKELLSLDEIKILVEKTKSAGAEIVGHLKTGSAYFAPAISIFEIIQAITKNQNAIYPVSSYLEGEYGFSGLYLGVPARIGKHGIEEIIEINLTDAEKTAMEIAAKDVKSHITLL